VGKKHDSWRVFCISTKQGNSGTQAYIIGLFKKLKEILGQTFFSANCVTSGMAWMSQWTLYRSIQWMLVKLGCSVGYKVPAGFSVVLKQTALIMNH